MKTRIRQLTEQEKRSKGEQQMIADWLKIFDKGILSIVSDTFDLWKLITEYLPANKEAIMARDGKLVIRPDSGDPVDIICGYEKYSVKWNELNGFPENKGVIELLWDIFGGTINEQGYKILDSHIGFIYGEGISQDMLNEIYARLDDKGFAASNVVVGIGSFSQIFCSRDTYGQAIKATAVQIKGELHNIYKDPKTSGNFNKKSAKGLMCVNKDMTLKQECTWEEESQGLLQTIYENGNFFNQTSLTEIRERINKNL